MTLAERLGHDANARLLIITSDNLGMYHAANVACYESLRQGIATNASLMVPAPWSREAVRGYRGADVGVHITLNADFSCYRWNSITHAPTLHSGEGGFPRTAEDLWEHADSNEVRRECRAQIERSVVWGFDPTHLDSHLSALVLRPELFDIYIDLACEFSLPIRLADQATEDNAGFPLRSLAEEEGILSPDRTASLQGNDRQASFTNFVASLEPGVTELSMQPAIDTPELHALLGDTQARIGDHAVLIDPANRQLLKDAGVQLISWVAIRDLQRSPGA
ncbi:ChbG/HpnK family deacetylase [Acidimicrobiales bacterium]|nr:ChbG/HpnK family deacetylase [Acidimicrobiales bacterium]MDB4818464.1 ChbG/HpnK family deacetylase [Acidimicrobiales bacterium]MDG1087272.1 ChbG/HpnK family deacetylase [Acidimicrobiales bacterium]